MAEADATAEPESILWYKVEDVDAEMGARERPPSRGCNACSAAAAAIVGELCLCSTLQPLCRPLFAYLWIQLVELGAVSVLLGTVREVPKLRVAGFLLLLLIHSLVTAGVVGTIDATFNASQRERERFHVHRRLSLMVCGAWLLLCWWLIEIVLDLRCRLAGSSWLLVVWSLFAYHLALAIVATQLAFRTAARMALCLPPPTIIKARKFAEVLGEEVAGDPKCTICLVDFEDDDAVLLLPCRHLFHAECCGQWLRRSDSCPLRCRNGVLRLPDEP
mmetsp:Transcript_4469/g.14415  ORF Transcript_4469/g.14415 Transcript_4469/m.14415 type:complete len:275 (+) Transcript_4469:63-887(+)